MGNDIDISNSNEYIENDEEELLCTQAYNDDISSIDSNNNEHNTENDEEELLCTQAYNDGISDIDISCGNELNNSVSSTPIDNMVLDDES